MTLYFQCAPSGMPVLGRRMSRTSGSKSRKMIPSNLNTWTALANSLVATGSTYTYSTNLNDAARYFRVYRTP